MTGLEEVRAAAAAEGLVLRKALPRAADHLLLELATPDGAGVPGQWFADPARAEAVARATAATAGVGQVRARGRVVLQPGGADRRLRSLRARVQEPGTVLVAHRPERRAVLRRRTPAGEVYDKLVRPDRVADLVRAARAPGGVRVPQLLAVDPGEGVVTTAALPGRTLHALLADPRTDGTAAARAGAATGRALRALHAGATAAGAPVHDLAAERAVGLRWAGLAAAHGALPGGLADDLQGRLADLAEPAAAPRAPLHRDLHDKQVLLPDDGPAGLLDLDCAAVGDPALDVANLLVHLQLRASQGHCPAERARDCAEGLLAGYGPLDAGRVAAYDLTTRCRLVAVYAFRPGGAAAARALLDAPALAGSAQ